MEDNSCKNEREFSELGDMYENLTLEQIENAWMETELDEIRFYESPGFYTLNPLIGFGRYETCALCQPVINQYHFFPKCEFCMYVVVTGSKCYEGRNKDTYDALKNAESPLDLFSAVQERIKLIDSIFREYLELLKQTKPKEE